MLRAKFFTWKWKETTTDIWLKSLQLTKQVSVKAHVNLKYVHNDVFYEYNTSSLYMFILYCIYELEYSILSA